MTMSYQQWTEQLLAHVPALRAADTHENESLLPLVIPFLLETASGRAPNAPELFFTSTWDDTMGAVYPLCIEALNVNTGETRSVFVQKTHLLQGLSAEGCISIIRQAKGCLVLRFLSTVTFEPLYL